MDLRNLATFLQVAESGSFTRAALVLGYSQPTVSFQVKQLELELGTQLFDRIGHTVSLTDDGHTVLGYAKQICQLTQEMALDTRGNQEPNGIVRLAIADSLCIPLVTVQMPQFRTQYPHISLQVITAGTGDLFRMLDHNEVDLVCTLDSHISNAGYVISNEEKIGAHFVCAPTNHLANLSTVSVESLLDEPLLLTEKGMSYRRLLDDQLAAKNLELQPVLEMGSTEQLCSLAESGVGIAFLPDYVTSDAIKRGTLTRLSVQDVHVELWKQLLYRREKWISRHMKAVLDFFSDIPLCQRC